MLLKCELVRWGKEEETTKKTWIPDTTKNQLPRTFQSMLYVILPGLTDIDTYYNYETHTQDTKLWGRLSWGLGHCCVQHTHQVPRHHLKISPLTIKLPSWNPKNFYHSAYATEHHRYRKMLGCVSWISQTVSKPLLTIFHVPISLLCAAVNAKM